MYGTGICSIIMKFALSIFLLCGQFFPSTRGERSFKVDYEKNVFLKDGKAFRYLSGSIHYARVPREFWDDRLKKIRAAGFNAIQFYTEWFLHEPRPGQYDFSGNRDIEVFIKTAQKNDLVVILRPGPFIDGERDMGGLPSWLLENGSINLRTNDPKFTSPVITWFKVLFSKLKKHLYVNGGPIIMIQVENEYGSYDCDTEYLTLLRNTIVESIEGEDKAVLFTTDGASIDSLRCGYTPLTLSTVDFGPTDPPSSMQGRLDQSILFRPQGPLINSEFYSGWLDHWGSPHAHSTADMVANALDWLLMKNVSVNMYMIHGGTSFGFEAGANSPPYQPTPTSYDYDAPISEAGDMTWKYEIIKRVASKYFPIPSNIAVKNSTKINYGIVELRKSMSLLDNPKLFTKVTSKVSENPLSFEEMKQNHGFLLYETVIPNDKRYASPIELKISELNDRAYLYLDKKPIGILTRMFGGTTSIPISGLKGNERLSIIVENQGRNCFGKGISEHKGILSSVQLQKRNLLNWTMTTLDFKDANEIQKIVISSFERNKKPNHQSNWGSQMSFWTGTFKTLCPHERSEIPGDTFVKLHNWNKGLVIVNGFNIGKYWPVIGPQETLYLPGSLLTSDCSQSNNITIFEQDSSPSLKTEQFIELVPYHILNGPIPG